ncbi:MAG TPA: hypothetical protein VGJ94_07380 [Syntrophorhabdaceae bacterium]
MRGKVGYAFLGGAVLLLCGFSAWAQERSQLADLLTTTPWCSFKYNKTTGYSSTTRYQFFRDGRYTTGAKNEGHSSGVAGNFSSQRNRTSGGNWQLKGNALFVTANGVMQEPVYLSVKQNSNGMPIIIADGVEFVPCQ